MQYDWESLSTDQIVDIALFLPIREIYYFCLASAKVNGAICNNNDFWFRKVIHDFGYPEIIKANTVWRDVYQNYGTVYAFGEDIDNELNGACEDELPCRTAIKARFIASHYHTIYIDLNHDVWISGAGCIYRDERVTGSRDYVVKRLTDIKAQYAAVGYLNSLLIDLDGYVWFHSYNSEIVSKLPYTAKQVSCLDYYSILLDFNNDVYILDYRMSGQIIGQDTFGKAQFITMGSKYSYVIDLDNNVWQLDYLDEPRQIFIDDNIPLKAKYISSRTHVIAIDLYGNVWTFGVNDFGQLGTGDTIFRERPTLIPLPFKCKQAACGDMFSVLLSECGAVYVCGDNEDFRLGLEDQEWLIIDDPTTGSGEELELIPTLTFTEVDWLSGKFITCSASGTFVISDYLYDIPFFRL